MNLKIMPLLAGALALTVAGAPLAVKAQPKQSNQPAPGQAQNKPGAGGVELTEQQQKQIAQIRLETRTQIEKIVTAQQRQQFQAAMQGGKGMRAAFAAMNLSQDQQTQLQAIVKLAQSRAEALLTPQQRQQIQQYMQQQRQQPKQ